LTSREEEEEEEEDARAGHSEPVHTIHWMPVITQLWMNLN
jgi:hypothetical protein